MESTTPTAAAVCARWTAAVQVKIGVDMDIERKGEVIGTDMAFSRADDTTFVFFWLFWCWNSIQFSMRGEVSWVAMYISRTLATV